jgi:polar amino acid transport system substrate-binding protein
MVRKNRNFHCLGILGVLMITCGLFPLSTAADSHNSLAVEFYFNGYLNSIVGEKIAPHTYVFNKGGGAKISIATLDWAPYIGENICKQGWIQQLTVALLASRGYEITSIFLPWARAVRMAETGSVDILYPEYFIELGAPSDAYKGTRRREHLALSLKLPGGPIAFMKRRGETDHYKGDLLNLKNEKIGVVRGYQNTPEFDALMDRNFFDISQSVDDLMNTTKLINNRIDLIIGDPRVIRFSIANGMLSQREKTKLLQSIEMVQPAIGYNHLYYAISKKRPSWEKTLALLNSAIAEFETSGLMFEIIETVNTTCEDNMKGVWAPL